MILKTAVAVVGQTIESVIQRSGLGKSPIQEEWIWILWASNFKLICQMGKDLDNSDSFSNKIVNFHKQELVPGKQMEEQLAQRTGWNSRFFVALEMILLFSLDSFSPSFRPHDVLHLKLGFYKVNNYHLSL